MSFHFRAATREGVGLIILVSGPSGGGKTWSSFALAQGMSGGKRFAVIDTENGRAKFYADRFAFDHGDLTAPFSPQHYLEAIIAADEAGYPVICVDSFSHEHAGEGGIIDMADAEMKRMGGGANVKMASWIAPKQAHKRLIYRMLQCKAHLVLTLRAESKIDMIKDDSGKMKVVPKRSMTSIEGYIPICEKNLPFEATASALLLPDAPGVPQWIKLPEPLRPMFPEGKPITEEAGKMLAAWAQGGATSAPASAQKTTGAKAVRNREEADCTHCNCVVEVGMGWSKDGKVIHVTCVEDAKAARGR